MSNIPHTMSELQQAKTIHDLISWGYENILFEKLHFDEMYKKEDAIKFQGYYHSFEPMAFLRKRYYEKRLTDALLLAKGKRVLVVGSGLGSEVFLFAASGARDVIGLDIDTDFIRQSEARAKTWGVQNVSFVEDGIITYTAPELFDLIFIMETYHHIIPKEDLFPAVDRLLQAHGYVVVCEPNGENPLVVHSMKKAGHRTGVIMKIGRHLATDEMFVPASTIVAQLVHQQFTIERISRYRIFPGVPFASLDYVLAKMEPLFERVIPLQWFGVGYTIIARKRGV